MEGQSEKLDLTEFRRVKKRHPVAIADGCPLELLYWLEHGATTDVFTRIGPVFDEFAKVLDWEFPLMVGARDLAAYCGIVPWLAFVNRRDAGLFLRAFFGHIRSIRSRDDVSRDLTWRNSERSVLTWQYTGSARMLKKLADDWHTKPVAEIALARAKMRGDDSYRGLTEDELIDLGERANRTACRAMQIPEGHPHEERLRLHSQMMVLWTKKAAHPGNKPPKEMKSNDVVDTILLYNMLLPAMVCTSDARFVRAVRELPSEDRVRVMLPSELIEFLRSGVLPR